MQLVLDADAQVFESLFLLALRGRCLRLLFHSSFLLSVMINLEFPAYPAGGARSLGVSRPGCCSRITCLLSSASVLLGFVAPPVRQSPDSAQYRASHASVARRRLRCCPLP